MKKMYGYWIFDDMWTYGRSEMRHGNPTPIGGKCPTTFRMRLEAEFLDEFEGGEIQLRFKIPGRDTDFVVPFSKNDVEDLYDGTYMISEKALKTFDIL